MISQFNIVGGSSWWWNIDTVSSVSKNFTFYSRVNIEKHISEVARVSNVLRFPVKIDIHFNCVVSLSPIKCILLIDVLFSAHKDIKTKNYRVVNKTKNV